MHQPLPWTRELHYRQSRHAEAWDIRDADGNHVLDIDDAVTEEGYDDSVFILRACNCHYDLLAVVEKVDE